MFGLNIADSKLRIVAGQVRFMSKYFLNQHTEQLTHGAEIFELSLGKENYAELADKKQENDYFTFQMTQEAIKEAFSGFEEKIMTGFVEMLAFDALIGHNDRHPYNWGIIVPIRKSRPPRFSPIYDTARALYWNIPEKRIKQMLNNKGEFEMYVQRCTSPIGWDNEPKVDFFCLIGLIWKGFPQYGKHIEKFLNELALKQCLQVLNKEFVALMSDERRELIKRCLYLRQQRLTEMCKI